MKYRNVRTKVGDRIFASKKEAKRYQELMLLQRAGEILSLECQPVIPCIVNGERVCNYIGDFKYTDKRGREIIEDAKGMLTPMYRLNRKLVKAIHGIEIVEV